MERHSASYTTESCSKCCCRQRRRLRTRIYIDSPTRSYILEKLKSYGENPGPILDTTRGLYQKKLAKRMEEKTKASDESRSREEVDYATDQMGEWSSHSSETYPEEREEEEAGALEEPVPVRLRSHKSSSSKSQQVVYRTI